MENHWVHIDGLGYNRKMENHWVHIDGLGYSRKMENHWVHIDGLGYSREMENHWVHIDGLGYSREMKTTGYTLMVWGTAVDQWLKPPSDVCLSEIGFSHLIIYR